jgi:hypothetical protein
VPHVLTAFKTALHLANTFVPLCLDILSVSSLSSISPFAPMSQTPSTSTSTSNFQSIFNAALKAYEKKTKKDLLAHPLAAQLQACNSPGDILTVLQDKVKEFQESRSADERLSRWLNPAINVLYAFSATLGQGVGLVGPIHSTCLHPLTVVPKFSGVLTRKRDLRWCWSPPVGEHHHP